MLPVWNEDTKAVGIVKGMRCMAPYPLYVQKLSGYIKVDDGVYLSKCLCYISSMYVKIFVITCCVYAYSQTF